MIYYTKLSTMKKVRHACVAYMYPCSLIYIYTSISISIYLSIYIYIYNPPKKPHQSEVFIRAILLKSLSIKQFPVQFATELFFISLS